VQPKNTRSPIGILLYTQLP